MSGTTSYSYDASVNLIEKTGPDGASIGVVVGV
ncbi:MAG: hypothetical protein GY854_00135 [Deltaproteobacteria bacterium]|nr:hypothetical protein [Deltaproteobacteria bacterium]